eukprot:2025873-Amphidinium_carterae.1
MYHIAFGKSRPKGANCELSNTAFCFNHQTFDGNTDVVSYACKKKLDELKNSQIYGCIRSSKMANDLGTQEIILLTYTIFLTDTVKTDDNRIDTAKESTFVKLE